jgi:hypothetical protein
MNTGKQILGKITSIDSTKVYIDINDGKEVVQAIVNKDEVKTIGYFNPANNNIPDRKDTYTLSASIGLCIATGVFASEDVSNSKSGFAGQGLNVHVILASRAARYFEFTVKGVFNANEFNTEKFIELINQLGSYKCTSNTGKYKFYSLFLGPTFVAAKNKVTFKGSFMLGYGNLKEPEIKFTTTSTTVKKWIKLDETSCGSLCYDIIAAIYIVTFENLYLNVNADYIFGNFMLGTSTISTSTGTSETYDRGTQNYSVFNISVGLGLKF